MEKVNIKKVIATIESSNTGELFHALFGGDLDRANGKIESASKSVINTLAWWLNGDTEAVAAVFSASALADKCTNAGALILKACKNLSGGFAGASSLYGEESEDAFINKREVNKSKSEHLKIADVENWLVFHNVTARFNMMSQSAEVLGYNERPLQIGNIMNTLPTIIADDLQDKYKGVSVEKIYQMLCVIVEGNAYHPVIEKLSSVEWDGKDRFPALFSLIGIDSPSSDNIFSQTLFKKWMKQSIAMLHNGENQTYGGEGVLTLNGPQGIGKTTLLRCMAIDRAFFREGQRLDDKDKDTARRCVTTWIAELGELDCTLKSDLGYLKAFITADVDSYRLPYGRTDITAPRRASLSASVNGDSYLVDPTGNRRFWTVKLDTIDVAGIQSFNFLQLWKQVENEMNGEDISKCFRLTREELSILEDRNGTARRGVKGESEIADIILTGGDPNSWDWMTVSRFKELFPVLRSYTVEQIGRVLKMLGIESKSKRVNGMPLKCYKLPSETNKYLPDGNDINTNETNKEDIPF